MVKTKLKNYFLFVYIMFISNIIQRITCPEKPTCKHQASIKDISQVVLILLFYYVCCFKAILSSLNSSSGLSSDKRQEDGAVFEDWGSSLPHAFALGFLSCAPAACQGSLFQPRPPLRHFGHGWHSTPLHPSCLFIIPSLHQWPFHRGSRVGFEQGLQLFLRNATELPSY